MWDGNESAYAGTTGETHESGGVGGTPPTVMPDSVCATVGGIPPTPPKADAATHHDPEGATSEGQETPLAAPDGLTPRQRLAVAALVGGRTFVAAARHAGVTRKTLFLWRQQPAFAAAVQDLSRGALEATAARARRLMLRATRNLAESLRGKERVNWSMRVLNSRRVWELAETMPDDPAAAGG